MIPAAKLGMLSLRAAGAAIDSYVIAQGAGFLGITRTLVISGIHFMFCQDPYLTYVSGRGGGGEVEVALK